MGVSQLWAVLGGAVRAFDGLTPANMMQLARTLDGKSIAIDTSIWLMEAQTQGAIMEAHGGHIPTVTLKLVFDRALCFLRYGVTPVLVLDGATSQAKAGRLGQRYTARTGIQLDGPIHVRTNAVPHSPIVNAVKSLAHALGVPVVQAAGEAEATCAVLNATGLVDAVQSKDGDSLLFGASTVYKTLRLQGIHKGCEAALCEMQDVRKALGLKGAIKALDAVKVLLAGKEDDSDLVDTFLSALHRGPDQHLLSLEKCTGCATCGHESGSRSRTKKHGRNGCHDCNTAEGCIPMPKGGQCQCEFHRRADERLLAKVIERAHSDPVVVQEIKDALKEYQRQCEAAGAAIQHLTRQDLRWQRRPQCSEVTDLLQQKTQLEWSSTIVRLKLRPVLIEWDLLQGAKGSPEVEFQPVAIQKGSGSPGTHDSHVWQVLLDLKRLPDRGTEQERQEDEDWLRGIIPRQNVTSNADADDTDIPATQSQAGPSSTQNCYESDTDDVPYTQAPLPSQLAGSSGAKATQPLGVIKNGSKAPSNQRTFRLSVMVKHWMPLVEAYLKAKAAKNEAKMAAEARKAARAAGLTQKAPKAPRGKKAPATTGALASQASAGATSTQPANRATQSEGAWAEPISTQASQGATVAGRDASGRQVGIRDYFKTRKAPQPAAAPRALEGTTGAKSRDLGAGHTPASTRELGTSRDLGRDHDHTPASTRGQASTGGPDTEEPATGSSRVSLSTQGPVWALQGSASGQGRFKVQGQVQDLNSNGGLVRAGSQGYGGRGGAQGGSGSTGGLQGTIGATQQGSKAPVIDLCTPSPPAKRAGAAQAAERICIDLCDSSSDDDAPRQQHQGPAGRGGAAAGAASPAKRGSANALASPSKRQSSHADRMTVSG